MSDENIQQDTRVREHIEEELNSITAELRCNVEQREEAESRAIQSRNAADSAREASDLAQRFAHAEVQGLQASLNSEQQSQSVLSERLVREEAAKQAAEEARHRSEAAIIELEASALACRRQLEAELAAQAALTSESHTQDLESQAAQSKEALELVLAGHAADFNRTLEEVAELRHKLVQQEELQAAAATDMAESKHELELSVASQAATATEELIADIAPPRLRTRHNLRLLYKLRQMPRVLRRWLPLDTG